MYPTHSWQSFSVAPPGRWRKYSVPGRSNLGARHVTACQNISWIFHCLSLLVHQWFFPQSQMWKYGSTSSQHFSIFLVFFPQAPVWSPMCPTSSINLVQWTLGCVGCPGYPHSRLIPQGNLRASRPWVTNDTSRRERERSGLSPIQKEITVPKHTNTIHVKFQRWKHMKAHPESLHRK